MPDYACAGRLTESDLQASIHTPPAPFDWMILEAVDEVLFDRFQPDIALSRFEVGRVFGSECELCWQRDGNDFHTLLIGPLAAPPSPLAANRLVLSPAEFDRVQREYFLWGEWSTKIPEWVEAAIPHIFNYPAPPHPGRWRRKLISVEYVNQQTGEMEFYRFAGVREEEL